MYISQKKIKHALQIFRQNDGILRSSQAFAEGIHRRTLYYLRDEGLLLQQARGLYQLADGTDLPHLDLVLVTKKIPQARICMISALAFHEITDEIPHSVQIALAPHAWEPKLDYPPIQVFRFSDSTREAGFEIHEINKISIAVYSPAKTIADCFKFRNQIGLNVAIEALKRGLEKRKATFKDIMFFAKLCNVEKIILPYLEAVGHG